MKWVPAVKFFKQVQSICCPVDFVLGKAVALTHSRASDFYSNNYGKQQSI